MCTPMAFFLDREFDNLVWQPERKGAVLKPGYSRVELRFVHRIVAGEDDRLLVLADPTKGGGPTEEEKEARRRCCLCLHMSAHARKKGYSSIYMELDTEAARNDMLDGLRVIRCAASMLFQQNLDEHKARGCR